MTERYWERQAEAPAGHINVVTELRFGAMQMSKKRDEEDPKGVIRGGSVCAVVGSKIFGECPRLAHLRFLGKGRLLDEQTKLMTDQGEAVEESVLQEFIAAGWNIRRQNEWEVSFELKGVKGKVSPDCTLLDSKGEVVYGVELKNVSSMFTARDVHFEFAPNSKHLIQAANNAIRVADFLGRKKPIPWSLLYTSRVKWHLMAAPKWFKEKAAEAGVDLQLDAKDGHPVAIEPFLRAYYIDWTHDGYMTYWTAGLKQPRVTPINRASIDLGYRASSVKIEESQNLGPRPAATDLFGNKKYSPCDYCSHAPVCDSYEGNYAQWRDYSFKHLDEVKKERWAIKDSLVEKVVNGAAAMAAADMGAVTKAVAEIAAAAKAADKTTSAQSSSTTKKAKTSTNASGAAKPSRPKK